MCSKQQDSRGRLEIKASFHPSQEVGINQERNWQAVLHARLSRREAIRAAAFRALSLPFVRVGVLAQSVTAASATDYALRLAQLQKEWLEMTLEAGDCVYFPLGWPHWFRNSGSSVLRAYFNYGHEQPETVEVQS